MNHKKSFWGGVITGVLAAALIVSGVFLGQSVWNLYQSSRTQETAAQNEEDGVSSNSVANAQTMNKLQVLEDTIDRYYPVSYTHLDVYKRQIECRVAVARGGGSLLPCFRESLRRRTQRCVTWYVA